MQFRTHIFKVIKINKETEAKHFKDIEIGDSLQFSISLIKRSKRKGLYALGVDIVHKRDHKTIAKWSKTQNTFLNLIKNFKFAIEELQVNLNEFEDIMNEIENSRGIK